MTNLNAMLKKLQQGMVAVVGIPFDENSSFSRGPALASKRIRKALNSGSANLCTEHGLEKALGFFHYEPLPTSRKSSARQGLTPIPG
jgi:hypothetical protein